MKITQNIKLLLFFFFITLLFIAVSADESKCECLHEDDEKNKAGAKKYKIAAIPSVLAAGVIGVLFPLLGKVFPSLRPETNFFFVIKAFAAGVILATGFMHVLLEGYDKLTSSCLKGEVWKFPFTGLIAMVAAILTLSVDSFATSYFHKLHFKTSKKIGEEQGGGDGGGGGDELGLHVHAHGHTHGTVAVESSQSEVQLNRTRVVAQVKHKGIWLIECKAPSQTASNLGILALSFLLAAHFFACIVGCNISNSFKILVGMPKITSYINLLCLALTWMVVLAGTGILAVGIWSNRESRSKCGITNKDILSYGSKVCYFHAVVSVIFYISNVLSRVCCL